MYKDAYHPRVKQDLKKLHYVIDEQAEIVSVLMIAKRGEFYQLLKRRIKRR
jgi:hypothetical protein